MRQFVRTHVAGHSLDYVIVTSYLVAGPAGDGRRGAGLAGSITLPLRLVLATFLLLYEFIDALAGGARAGIEEPN
ncbi:hypothetical protein BVC93_24850 [Mycobacterium sp. MS1601]|uniref:hypothetical protein n=1 Tax=Mycobacterium sp. MS1601 TaxID=1936029 RepID=UPI0009791582|nr:hypothetical protein [Mycobacterium sp. MS1601]AQA05096.1 hypothetical protein BVC93_24850 [Mycobacterium sp. MS1601]